MNELTTQDTRGSIVYLCTDFPTSVDISFLAVDNPELIADSIGDCLEAVLNASRRGWKSGTLDEAAFQRWAERARNLDSRIQVQTPWSSVDYTMTPISIFGAGGGAQHSSDYGPV